jgi:hypothetical protein
MFDSTLIMNSMAYDLRCETFRFAWRNIRFVFLLFGLGRSQNEMKPKRAAFGWNRHREARSAAAIQTPWGADDSWIASLTLAITLARSWTPGQTHGLPKKLRKSAAKPMKSLWRVNLCAGASALVQGSLRSAKVVVQTF